MRLWSIHPRFLDQKGLVALWREGLLAQKVLSGQTKGYRNHPQLLRFSDAIDPMATIGSYLLEVAREASARTYVFNESKIQVIVPVPRIALTSGQLAYEWGHFLQKAMLRTPRVYEQYKHIVQPEPHPLFLLVPGEKAVWERGV